LIVAGGLVTNGFLMQLYADVTRRPLSLIASAQGPALGAAIHAAVAVGAYPDVPAAARAMGKVERAAYLPDPERAAAYDVLYAEYLRLHDYFGLGANEVLHRLRDIRLHAYEGTRGAAARDVSANINREAS
jgi:L-ribulokinase